MTRRPHAQHGFTLVELVIVMLLMALLAGLGASRFASTDVFAAQSVADRLASGLRTAQATAIAQRRDIHVQLVSSPLSMNVCLDAACAQPLTPVGTSDTWLPPGDGLSLDSNASFSFSPGGGTSLSASLDLRVMGGSATTAPTVRIEASSGLVTRP
jgi:MSHA pilin protein MshC